MGIRKILGNDEITGANGASTSFKLFDLFVSAVNAKATGLVFYSIASGTAKTAVYLAGTETIGDESTIFADNTGVPATGGTWNTVPVNLDIESGLSYYLAAQPSVVGAYTRTSVSGGSSRYLSSSFVSNFPGNLTGSNYQTITDAIYLVGWVPPVITSVNGGNPVSDTGTGIAVAGTDFMDSGCKIWLCSTNNFATAPIKVEQTVTAQNDSSATLNVVPGDLETGTVYAFAETSLGQVSPAVAVPFEVTPSGRDPERFFIDLSSAENGDGSSWDSPFDSLAPISGAVALDEYWIKEHDGAIVEGFECTADEVKILGGFSQALTGVEGNPATRGGLTRLLPLTVGTRAVTTSGESVAISRLWADDFESTGEGGGFRISGDESVLTDCVATNCTAESYGGGFAILGEACVVDRATAVWCVAGFHAGGVAFTGVWGTLRDSVVTRCNGQSIAGGVYMEPGLAERCKISMNTAVSSGVGGIRANGVILCDCVISKNSSIAGVGGVDALSSVVASTFVVNCTVVDNSGSVAGGVRLDEDARLDNSIVSGNTGGYQILHTDPVPGVVNNCSIDALNQVSPQSILGASVVVGVPAFLPPPLSHKPDEVNTEIATGGSPYALGYSGVDITGRPRKATPSIGAYEIGYPLYVPPAYVEETADEILEKLDREIDTDFWTQERLDALRVVQSFPTMWGAVSTKLDGTPVKITIKHNDVDDGYFIDLSSDDGSIVANGLRISTGVDILDGLAFSELGKLIPIDLDKKGADPSYEGLGTRFALMYLPRGYA